MTPTELLQTAHDVLDKESKALELLANSQDDSFVQAVDVINKTKGRVIVTGMGKSGHVGRKIAASLSSLGTTALWLGSRMWFCACRPLKKPARSAWRPQRRRL